MRHQIFREQETSVIFFRPLRVGFLNLIRGIKYQSGTLPPSDVIADEAQLEILHQKEIHVDYINSYNRCYDSDMQFLTSVRYTFGKFQ